MNFEFLLPDVGEGLAEAEVVEWLVAVGDTVTVDQPVAVMETDKMSVELPSPVDGKVVSFAADVGEKVAVHSTLMTIETAGAAPDGAAPSGNGAAPPASADADERSAVVNVGEPTAVAPAEPVSAGLRPKASPAVRRLARDRGIDLTAILGTGPSGRIVRDDLDRPAAVDQAAPPVLSPTLAMVPASVETERLPFRGIRRKIAENVSKSWTQIPMALDFREVDGSALLKLRKAIVAAAPEGVRVGFDAILARIVATALRRHRILNAMLDEAASEVVLFGEINIGIAVAADNGVIVPVIHRADQLTIYEIAARLTEIATRARGGGLEPSDLRGGTITLNNTGALNPKGGLHTIPLINHPQAAMISFGRIHDRVVAVDGRPEVRPGFFMTCNADHRLIDGEGLVAFMNDVVDMVEDPSRLIGELR